MYLILHGLLVESQKRQYNTKSGLEIPAQEIPAQEIPAQEIPAQGHQ